MVLYNNHNHSNLLLIIFWVFFLLFVCPDYDHLVVVACVPEFNQTFFSFFFGAAVGNATSPFAGATQLKQGLQTLRSSRTEAGTFFTIRAKSSIPA